MSRPPAEEYRHRLGQRRDALAALSRLDLLISRLRLAVFAVAVLLVVLASRGDLSPWWLLAPIVAFLIIVVRHDRILRAMRAGERAIAFYERGLARIEDRWADAGETGERFADDRHLYARDLDLFGPGSLFQLLSIARTKAGEQILAAWLKSPASRGEILSRHDAVRELAPGLDLREQIAVAGTDVRRGIDPDALIGWAEGPPLLTNPLLRVAAAISTTVVIVTSLLVLRGTAPFAPLLIALAVQGLLSAVQRARVELVMHTADAPARELGVLCDVLVRLEAERFTAPRLAAVHALLESGPKGASQIVAKLRQLVEFHDWQHNIVFAPIAAMLLWETHLAWAIEHWRRAHGAHVRGWLDAAGQFEAFSSLAAYRFEHPDDPFPEILPLEGSPAPAGPQFAAVALAHPLIGRAQVVANDVTLTGDTRLLVISGSNMSGKSTLLRTVGINTVLALAGAPVRATSLQLTPMALGATLRIQDSLQEGRSRFYAEITRIREIAAVAGRGEPLLFLLDELFHGTNSHDRLVGASGVLTSLLQHQAIGLITTHDLALTAVADRLAPHAVNVHFEDWFEGGEIRFDYTMKPGPVTRSNAVALMRAVGLDVPVE